MKLANETIESLSEKFSRQFTFRMPSAAHLLADLKQEAAIAIITCAPRWTKTGGANFETFTRIYAWRAMQELCTKQSGPVSKPMVQGQFEGTGYALSDGRNSHENFERSATGTPEDAMERKNADEIVRDFIERRSACFTGKGKISRDVIKNILRDYLTGDSGPEIGERYGCSKERVRQLAAQARIA